jgi:hypothetical protein
MHTKAHLTVSLIETDMSFTQQQPFQFADQTILPQLYVSTNVSETFIFMVVIDLVVPRDGC